MCYYKVAGVLRSQYMYLCPHSLVKKKKIIACCFHWLNFLIRCLADIACNENV